MVVQRCYAREVTRSQNTTTQRDGARFSGKRRCGYLQKLLDGCKLEALTVVCFAVSMCVVVGAGDGDEESTEGNDVQKMEERRLGESWLGQLDRGNAWKKGVVAKSGAGDVATSSKCRRTHQTSLRAKVVWAADLLGEELGEGSAAHFVRGKARPPPTTRPAYLRCERGRHACFATAIAHAPGPRPLLHPADAALPHRMSWMRTPATVDSFIVASLLLALQSSL
ncbi:hypothetical protein BKA58DRAFT_157207 [Alternaria rosae]|uniref:uncharacterized protein n=1 Tax=Alternaria rosae TaxID=1187941 RepID=UPI001E8D50CA|nr:uncharacterized protein BKA58DRAFT_157207 [Alternaria rosae]KAH6872947.1 hypothetical protein BKA58DRAFT_157207 [Alternaria rosae]